MSAKPKTFDEPEAIRVLQAWRTNPNESNFLSFVECAAPLFGVLLNKSGLRFYRSEQEWHQEFLIVLNRLLVRYDPGRSCRLFYFLLTSFRRYFLKERQRFSRWHREMSCPELDPYFRLAHPVMVGARSFSTYDVHPYWVR
jgi:hypothetical protein